jgi:hypothetical protein
MLVACWKKPGAVKSWLLPERLTKVSVTGEMDRVGGEAEAPHLDHQLRRLLRRGGRDHEQRHERDGGAAGKRHRILLPGLVPVHRTKVHAGHRLQDNNFR